ncbi:hypothetical protein JYT20_01610, partial [Rhodothermus sp. AH-315-K08]|nr:hypothetical protein [Rhodothermus sp. AH-315-K08]
TFRKGPIKPHNSKPPSSMQTTASSFDSSKMEILGHMAAGIAHELNNPIGYVNANLETMQGYLATIGRLGEFVTRIRETGMDAERLPLILAQLSAYWEEEEIDYVLEDSRDLVDESARGILRAAEIVSSIRSFASPQSAVEKAINPSEVMRSALNLSRNRLKYHCEIVEEIEELPCFVRASEGALGHVLVSLLVNAAEAITDTGTVRVRVWEDGEWVYLSVGDTGPGFGPEAADRLFDSSRAEESRLPGCREIVQSFGGEIELETVLGDGATFTVRLPRLG